MDWIITVTVLTMPIWEVIVRLWYFGVEKYGDALKRAKQATLEGSQMSVVLRTMEDKLTRLERETRMLIETVLEAIL